MTALAGPYLIACTILGLGGIAKVAVPLPARQALRAVGVPAPLIAVRALGLAELALACAAGYSGGTILPSAVGMTYLGFAGFVVVMLGKGERISCGCFGTSSTPPSYLHVVVNLLSAAAAFGSIGSEGLVTTLEDQAGAGLPLVSLVIIGSYALYLLLTMLPVVLAPPTARVSQFALVDPEDPTS